MSIVKPPHTIPATTCPVDGVARKQCTPANLATLEARRFALSAARYNASTHRSKGQFRRRRDRAAVRAVPESAGALYRTPIPGSEAGRQSLRPYRGGFNGPSHASTLTDARNGSRARATYPAHVSRHGVKVFALGALRNGGTG